MEKTRRASFYVNQRDDGSNTQYRIIALMLSSVPIGTLFGRGEENLDSKLTKVLKMETDKQDPNKLITDNFKFDHTYSICKDVNWLLSSFIDFGAPIGLENWGPDYRYRVTERTHRIADEIKELELFSEEEIQYLQNIGRELLKKSKK